MDLQSVSPDHSSHKSSSSPTPEASSQRWEPLQRKEFYFITLLLSVLVLFSIVVEYRSAFLKRRMTDLNCYLRAAWAVRQGGSELYNVWDDNTWHYNYPPLFAILLTPLADPPTKDEALLACSLVGLQLMPGSGTLQAISQLPVTHAPLGADWKPMIPFVPWPVSVLIYYFINLGLLALSLHWLASSLEATVGERWGWSQPTGSRRWFMLRMLPLIACLIPIGHTLGRSQANLYLLTCFCGMIASWVRGRSYQAGLCLAGAICLKIFPAYLLMVPLMRRDGRCLTGVAIGLIVGILLIPALVMGPVQTLKCYQQLGEVLLGPALGIGDNQTRAQELIDATATDSQSFQMLIHNTMHPDQMTRPRVMEPVARRIHFLLGGCLTLITVAIGWRHRQSRGPALVLLCGSLILLMLLISPVCHTHYFSLLIPIFAGLLAHTWNQQAAQGASGRITQVPMAIWSLVILLQGGFVPPLLSFFLRELCLMTYTVVFLWGYTMMTLFNMPVEEAEAQSSPGRPPAISLGEAA